MMALTVMRAFVDTLTEEGRSPIADEVVARWSHDPGTVRYLRASANFVFTFESETQPQVLRFNRVSERSRANVEGEIAFMDHLRALGVPVPRAVRSLTGRQVEHVRTSLATYHAVVFEAFQGLQHELEDLTIEQFSRWGAALGDLHCAARSFRGSGRPSLRERVKALERQLPPGEHAARRALGQVNARLQDIPTEGRAFGVIHGDFELDNIIWSGSTIGTVDFDDCAWGWFGADIAFALRDLFEDSADNVDWDDRRALAFLQGYRTSSPLSEGDLAHIPLFVQMHNLMTFARLLSTLDVAEGDPVPEWLEAVRQRLIDKVASYRTGFERAHSPDGSGRA